VAILDGWRVCPRCGGDLRSEPGRVECGACGFVFYANPKPTACALIVDAEGRILLARRAAEIENGKWDLPGGYLEEGEDPVEAMVREVREETGLEIEVGEFHGAWMDWYGDAPDAASTVNLYWLARAVGGEPVAADDVDALRWFAPDELPPPDEVAFENVPLVLRAWREQHA
jgi:mutator protein MutT